MKKKIKPPKEVLLADLAATRKKLNAIEERETRERNAALLGKCFRYRNCYSCPSKPSDYWWLYSKVVEAGLHIRALTFQVDKYGDIRIERRAHVYAASLERRSGYQPISAAAFEYAWRACMRRAAACNATRKEARSGK